MFASLVAAIVAALLHLPAPHVVAHAGEAHAPGNHPGASASAAGHVAPPTVGRQRPARPTSPTVATPPAPDPSRMVTCGPGTEWQGADFGCVATQLPGETDGRQYG